MIRARYFNCIGEFATRVRTSLSYDENILNLALGRFLKDNHYISSDLSKTFWSLFLEIVSGARYKIYIEKKEKLVITIYSFCHLYNRRFARKNRYVPAMAPSIPLPWSSWKRERSANENDDREPIRRSIRSRSFMILSGPIFRNTMKYLTTTTQVNIRGAQKLF